MRDLTFVLAGPVRHGVRLHAQALGWRTRGATLVNVEDGALPQGPVHVHFTDRIFGQDALQAADRLAEVVGSRPLTLTLHDLPQASDGVSFERRSQGYARVVAGARGVQVSSEHERGLLHQVWTRCGTGPLPPVAVVPLPVDRPARWGPAAGARERADGAVVVLGFVYPGKGHAETLAAMASLPPSVPLVALGAPSEGHEDLLVDLAEEAAAQGRSFLCTGYVTEEALQDRTRRAGVPVSAHTHISASGSINRWISAGRRPIVTPGAYVGELHRRAPWAVTVADDLPAAIAAALDDPMTTWIRQADWDSASLPDTATAAALQRAAIDALGPV